MKPTWNQMEQNETQLEQHGTHMEQTKTQITKYTAFLSESEAPISDHLTNGNTLFFVKA